MKKRIMICCLIILAVIAITMPRVNVYATYMPDAEDNLFYGVGYQWSSCSPSNLSTLGYTEGTSIYDEVNDLNDTTSDNYSGANDYCFDLPLSDISVLKLNSNSVSSEVTFYNAEGTELYSKTFGADDTNFYDINVSQVKYAIVEAHGAVFTLFAALGDDTGEEQGDRALIVITLISGLEYEYDWSIEEVNEFISWYDTKASGTGPARFEVVKDYNQGPFVSRINHLIFAKIITFEVMEYNE